jgi:hypothetical protein
LCAPSKDAGKTEVTRFNAVSDFIMVAAKGVGDGRGERVRESLEACVPDELLRAPVNDRPSSSGTLE